MVNDDDEEVDAMEQTGKHAIAAIAASVDDWIESRRQLAESNDIGEETERARYFKDRDEAIRARNVRVAETLRGHVKEETLERLLPGLSEEIG